MNPIAKVLIMSGSALILTGLIWQFATKAGLGRLPGDIAIGKENFRFYFPLTTSIIVSFALSLVFYLYRIFNK